LDFMLSQVTEEMENEYKYEQDLNNWQSDPHVFVHADAIKTHEHFFNFTKGNWWYTVILLSYSNLAHICIRSPFPLSREKA
jgi:hypothetical protein